MRILFLATYFPDPLHPARGNWALEQAQAFNSSGDEVKVVVPTSYLPGLLGRFGGKLGNHAITPREWTTGGLEIAYPRWPYYPWQVFRKLNSWFPQSFLRLSWPFLRAGLSRIIQTFRPEIVFAHHTLVSGQVARLIHDKWAIPYIVTDHEVGDLLACEHNPHYSRVFHRVAERARAMVVVSKAMQSAGRAHLPGLTFHVIHNGSSFPVYPGGAQRSRSQPLTIFSCAKFYQRKDIPLLIRAFDEVANQFDVRLRIAGDGPDRLKVENAVASASNRDRVELLGLLDSEAVRREMEQADIFALVGWAEPFGVVFLEAMATGLPIVVSKDAGISEVLEDGRTARFSNPRDPDSVVAALKGLIEDEDLRDQIGKNGQQLYASRFQWPVVLEQYRTLMTPAGIPRENV